MEYHSRLSSYVRTTETHRRRHCWTHLTECRGEIFLSPPFRMQKYEPNYAPFWGEPLIYFKSSSISKTVLDRDIASTDHKSSNCDDTYFKVICWLQSFFSNEMFRSCDIFLLTSRGPSAARSSSGSVAMHHVDVSMLLIINPLRHYATEAASFQSRARSNPPSAWHVVLKYTTRRCETRRPSSG